MEISKGYFQKEPYIDNFEMDKTSEIFISRSKELMKKKGIRQNEISAYSGYTKSGISNLLQNGNKAYGTLKAMAQMLGTSTDYLLGLTDTDENTQTQPIPIIAWNDVHKISTLPASGLTSKFAIWYPPNGEELPEDWFCVRTPNSYAEPRYYEGDIILVEPVYFENDKVSSSDLAIVYLRKMDQSVICYVKKGFMNYVLTPENKEFSDDVIKVKPEEIRIIGKCRDILKEEL